jgi:alkylation response protein AidB-like acyl-CoA dehydrogenase
MDFALSEEQGLLAASLRRFLEAECPVTRVRELVARRPGHDGGAWKRLAELGVAGLLVPEAHGGSGLGLLDAALAAESLAWGVAPGPFLGSAVMAPVALCAAGSAVQQARWLPRLATGECRFGVAANELVSKRDGAGVALREGRLEGLALMVIDGLDADQLLVPVDEGRSLARIEVGAAGVACTPLRTIDRTRGFAEVRFEGARVDEWIGEPGAARPACLRMLDAARVALAADCLGASERDRVIGSFQAVKHLCAEMVAELEPARSLVWYAAHAFDAVPEEATLMALHAKAHLSEIGPFIVRTATEVHGGIGFTDEQNLHYWFKRVGVDRQLLGGPEALREQAARLQGWID